MQHFHKYDWLTLLKMNMMVMLIRTTESNFKKWILSIYYGKFLTIIVTYKV